MKPTKEQKKARDNLERFSRAIYSQFSFGKLKTFNDLLLVAGLSQPIIDSGYFPSEKQQPLDYSIVKEYLTDRAIELTTKQWLESNPPLIENYTYVGYTTGKLSSKDNANIQNFSKETGDYIPDTESEQTTKTGFQKTTDISNNKTSNEKDGKVNTSKRIKLPKSSRQNCTLKDFQEKYTSQMIAGFISL